MPKGTIKYNYSTHTLTFLGSQYGASFGALEDWAHVAQYEVFYQSDIPSNRTLEFEAKMFCDLNCAIRGIDACSALGFGFEKNIDLLVKYNEFKECVSKNIKISDYLDEYYVLGEGWDDPNYQSGTFQKQSPELLNDLFK